MFHILVSIMLIFTSTPDKMGRVKFEEVIDLIQNSKWEESENEIKALKLKYSDDPEYYVLLINYYAQKSKSENIQFIPSNTRENSDKLIDHSKDSTSDNSVGYVSLASNYDYSLLLKGLDEFRIGLARFPNRLDMHFGLAYTLSDAKLINELERCLIDIIKISKQNNNMWLWSFDEQYQEDPKSFMIENLQGYLSSLFELNSQKSDSVIYNVSKEFISSYPENIYGYNNIGAILSIRQNYAESNNYFEQALKFNPNDKIVIANLVNNYSKLGNITKVKFYLEYLIKNGDDESKEWAKIKLNDIVQ